MLLAKKILESDGSLKSIRYIIESTSKVSQTVEIELSFEDGNLEIFDGLLKELNKAGFELYSGSAEDGWIDAVREEGGTYYYSPEKRTGVVSGDPAEYELEDISTKSEVEEFLKTLQKDFDFEIESVSCPVADEYGFN